MDSIVKKRIIISTIVIIILFGVYFFNTLDSSRYNKYNKISDNLLKDKVYNNIKFHNIAIKEVDGNLHFSTTLINEDIKQKSFKAKKVTLKFKDKENKSVCNEKFSIPNMEVYEKKKVDIIIDKKCKTAYTIIVEE